MKLLSLNNKKIFSILILLSFSALLFAQQEKPDALKMYNEGKYAESIKVCEQELVDTPNNLDSYVVLCWALVANGQYAEAETRATQGRNVDSSDVRLIEVLGEAKYYLGKNKDAMNLFERYVATVQQNASRLGKVYWLMGEIYIRESKFEHADISLSMAVRIDTNRDDWWTRLGYAREQLGDFSSAISAYDRALALNSTLSDALNGKVRCQQHL